MKIAQVVGPKIPFSKNLPHTPFSIPAMSYLMTEELVKRGHKVTVFAPSDSKTSAQIAPNTLSSAYLKKHRLMRGTRANNKRYKKIAHNHFLNVIKQSNKFDIIHNHELGFLYFSPKSKAPVVTTLHYHIPDVKSPDLLQSRKNSFIAISKKQTVNFPFLRFAGVIHHGIDVKNFKFNAKPKNYIGWLGRITYIKGAKEAIQAAVRSDETIKLAGNIEKDELDSKYTKTVLRMIKKYDNVTYVGKVGYNRKISFLKNAKVILMPIRWEEPFGLVAIEALSCGTPVIAFDNGALPEIIKDGITGYVVKSLPSMVKAIAKIDQIDRRDCRNEAEKYFTVERMVDDHEKLYKKVVKKYKK